MEVRIPVPKSRRRKSVDYIRRRIGRMMIEKGIGSCFDADDPMNDDFDVVAYGRNDKELHDGYAGAVVRVEVVADQRGTYHFFRLPVMGRMNWRPPRDDPDFPGRAVAIPCDELTFVCALNLDRLEYGPTMAEAQLYAAPDPLENK